ncbi:hypothetical protein GCM10011391_18930 [Pullulanibacillus camelliae]|uniref:Acyl-protein synthetase LuxE domain-containing protein n=1 Tax=Pullulanibacillus camelliae TaxID=1707096 RepID=A0A8J2VSD1_9BACL|nr:hypothetical protein [Pullulanibacillus camelliae]GGE40368.1 hypothetical protein GCM10011391_18930 [Pullulanibacillus camelliae]
MKDEKSEITAELLAFIHKYSENQNLGESYERAFNALALKLFTYQFKHNLAYKKLCQSKRKSPLTVKHWRDIPPMPLQGFKELTLSCTPVEEAEAVFMTSGTTNPEKRGRNYHPNLTTWDASMRAPFKEFVLPDRENMTIFVLSPAEDMNQQSSLSRYLTNALKYFGTERSESFFHEDGLEMERLVDALRESERRKEAVLLMGASFAYVHFLDYCKTHQLHFSLPEGSRIFDTGGFKGQSREVSPEALIQDYAQYFHKVTL